MIWKIYPDWCKDDILEGKVELCYPWNAQWRYIPILQLQRTLFKVLKLRKISNRPHTDIIGIEFSTFIHCTGPKKVLL